MSVSNGARAQNVPPPPPNPYAPNEAGYNSILGLFAKLLHKADLRARATSNIGGFVIVVQTLLIAFLILRPPQVYALAVDSSRQSVDVAQLKPLDKSPDLQLLVIEGTLPNFVQGAFTINDADSVQFNLDHMVNPYVLAGSTAQTNITGYLNALKAGGQGNKVHVDVDDKIAREGSKFIVGYTTRATDQSGNLVDAHHYFARVTVAWYPRSKENLTGLFITGFEITSESRLQK